MSELFLVEFLREIVLAMVVGGIMGTEREWSKHAAGLRTFILITVMGMALTKLELVFEFPNLVIVGLAFVSLISAELYWMKLEKKTSPGLTTSIVLVLAYILGILIGKGFYLEALSVSIIVTFLLAAKELLHHSVRNLTQKEIVDAMKFGIVSFVILPILPNKTIDPWGLFNPHLIWLMAVLVLGIGFASYVAIRAFGASRGLGVTALLGGLVSSTALTVSMAGRIKRYPKLVSSAAVAITLANSMMFLKALIITYIIHQPLAVYLFYPMIAATVVGISSTALQFRQLKEKVAHHIKFKSQLAFGPAIEFAILFAIIGALSILGREMLGTGGIYLASFIGGMMQMNPVLVLMSTMAKEGEILLEVAGKSVLIAALVNTMMKGGICYKLGNKKLGDSVIKSFILMVAAALFVIMMQSL